MKLYKILAVLAAILIVVAYFQPIWWVALQSHQYPKEMYPKGIRIEFKFNGVYNGCEGVKEREELATSEGADCLIEMTAINHYIGMFAAVQGMNRTKGREYPVYYVFDTEKDANGVEVIDADTGKPKMIDVTPGFLKFLDKIMFLSPYLLGLLVLLSLIFAFTSKKLFGLFAIIPALLPFYFLGMYIYGLYWYGHHLGLHGGGAFAGIKPFMPTVFGEGKVAQFSTISYPYFGFFLLLLVFVLMILAYLMKKKDLKRTRA